MPPLRLMTCAVGRLKAKGAAMIRPQAEARGGIPGVFLLTCCQVDESSAVCESYLFRLTQEGEAAVSSFSQCVLCVRPLSSPENSDDLIK